MIADLLSYPFMRHAALAALLASVVCGVLGPIIVLRRQVMLVSGIAHAAFGGVGLSRFLGMNPRLGAYGFTVLLALVAAPLSWKRKNRTDTLMGILWSAGMAIGLVFNDLAPGYGADLMSYLFGSILTVSSGELWFMALLALLGVGVVWWRYHQIEAFLFDANFARTRGVAVKSYHFWSVMAASLAVVVIIRVVGLILVIALFTIPPYIAERHAKSLAGIMVLSSLLSGLFCLTGLWLSWRYDLTAGAAIILVGCAVQALDLALYRKTA